MNDDALLLRRYVEEASGPAFTELVHRHVDLVYSAALRRTCGNTHLAADVAQQVFTTLARHAGKLSRHAVLSAWLYTATRNAALNLMISERRRRVRESEALTIDASSVTEEKTADWEQLRPLLDAAIDELPEADRAAVVLRFLERRAFADIGDELHVSEDAARMRTERALDKLRAVLASRGITSAASALGAIVSSQSLMSAPAGLATTLASQALTAAGAGFFFSTTFTSFMTTKIITTAALSALIAFGAGAYIGGGGNANIPPLRPETSGNVETIKSLRADNLRLQTEIAGLRTSLSGLDEANAQLAAKRVATAPAIPPKAVSLGLPRGELQRAVLNNLRQIAAARDQFSMEKGRAAGSIHDLVGRGSYIKTVRTVGGEDYAGLSMNPGDLLTVTTPDGVSVTFDPSGEKTTKPEIAPEVAHAEELGRLLDAPIKKAFSAYLGAHNGNNPPNERALLPYFATPKEGADFLEFLEARKAAGL